MHVYAKGNRPTNYLKDCLISHASLSHPHTGGRELFLFGSTFQGK